MVCMLLVVASLVGLTLRSAARAAPRLAMRGLRQLQRIVLRHPRFAMCLPSPEELPNARAE